MFNPLAVNPVGVYQQLIQQAQHDIPSLLPRVPATLATAPAHEVHEQHINQDAHQNIDLHTRIDYSPWLLHLYRHWQQDLENYLPKTFKPPSPPAHWQPESCAHACHDLMLQALGRLWHQLQQPLPEVIDLLTRCWQSSWNLFWQEVREAKANEGIQQALMKTLALINQFWIESCLHLAELHQTLPSEPNQS